jgi:hypothetical protein
LIGFSERIGIKVQFVDTRVIYIDTNVDLIKYNYYIFTNMPYDAAKRKAYHEKHKERKKDYYIDLKQCALDSITWKK